MTIEAAPYQPDSEELSGAAKLKLPADDRFFDTALEAARRSLLSREYERAQAILKGLVLARPHDPRVYEAFGVVHQAKGEIDKALACFKVAVDECEDTLLANVNLGEVAWRRDGDEAQARKHLERVLAGDPEGPFGARAKAALELMAQ